MRKVFYLRIGRKSQYIDEDFALEIISEKTFDTVMSKAKCLLEENLEIANTTYALEEFKMQNGKTGILHLTIHRH